MFLYLSWGGMGGRELCKGEGRENMEEKVGSPAARLVNEAGRGRASSKDVLLMFCMCSLTLNGYKSVILHTIKPLKWVKLCTLWMLAVVRYGRTTILYVQVILESDHMCYICAMSLLGVHSSVVTAA
jgi:hypothetical protein